MLRRVPWRGCGGISCLVAEYIVAIDVIRVRFPAAVSVGGLPSFLGLGNRQPRGALPTALLPLPHFSSRFVVRATAALGCAPAGLDLRNYSLQPRPGSPALGCTVCFELQCSRFGEMRIKLVAGTAWHASAMPSTQQQPTQH